MRKYVFGGIWLFLLVLSSCGPVYSTFYNYTPPQTQSGSMCVNQCLAEKTYCEQDCHARQLDCEYRADIDAEREYHDYVRAQTYNNQPIKKEKINFRRYCDEESACKATCTATHNLCYTNCGGVVSQHQECTAFCK